MIAARKSTLVGFSYVLAATVLWALVPISVKKVSVALDAYTMTWLRFAVSSLLLLLFAQISGELKRIHRRDYWLIILAGAGICLNYVLYTIGIKLTTASAGNVVVNFEAIWLVILGHLWLKDRLSGMKLLGTLITFAGVFAAIWNGEGFAALVKSDYFIGNMLIVACAPFWAVYGIAQKILVERGVAVSTALACIFAAAAVFTFPFMAAGYRIAQPLGFSVWVWLFVLVVLSTLGAYTLMAKGFETLDASTTGVITCVLPILTIFAARIFLSEVVTPTVFVGASLVVTGMIIIGHAEASSHSTSA
ncbi:MAG: DMT family transporter [Armatimonadota bacterium]|jgi:drug/metabolite transporter (DMT)-like permease